MKSDGSNIITHTVIFSNTEYAREYQDGADSRSDALCINNEKVDYEITFGNEKIVFIKAGAGGSVRGFDNKYSKMARCLHERTGATVICASNPDVLHEDVDEAEIRRVINDQGLSDFEISFIGISDGGYHNLSLARRFSETVKFIGINTSYITSSELKERVKALNGVFKVFIHGTNDYDFGEIVPELSKIDDENLEIKLVEGADHSFTGMVEELVTLTENLYNKKESRIKTMETMKKFKITLISEDNVETKLWSGKCTHEELDKKFHEAIKAQMEKYEVDPKGCQIVAYDGSGRIIAQETFHKKH